MKRAKPSEILAMRIDQLLAEKIREERRELIQRIIGILKRVFPEMDCSHGLKERVEFRDREMNEANIERLAQCAKAIRRAIDTADAKVRISGALKKEVDKRNSDPDYEIMPSETGGGHLGSWPSTDLYGVISRARYWLDDWDLVWSRYFADEEKRGRGNPGSPGPKLTETLQRPCIDAGLSAKEFDDVLEIINQSGVSPWNLSASTLKKRRQRARQRAGTK